MKKWDEVKNTLLSEDELKEIEENAERDSLAVNFKLFQVGEDYAEFIVAQTPEEALQEFNSRSDDQLSLDDVTEVSLVREGNFETQDGYKQMTFGEFLEGFIYEKPQVICWNE